MISDCLHFVVVVAVVVVAVHVVVVVVVVVVITTIIQRKKSVMTDKLIYMLSWLVFEVVHRPQRTVACADMCTMLHFGIHA